MFQCAPNLSSGRDPVVLEEIRSALRSLDGVRLADLSADPDHNRLVVSLLGTAAAMPQAIYRLFEVADRHIDLSSHEGCHPRIGAVDVVPFVPLFGTPMQEAVALAVEVGEGIATRFEVPVFLYEEACRFPERRLLPDLRKGQLSGVAQRIASPGGAPDFGPSALHKRLGACVVGARHPLVAFNIVLASQDMELARSIAHQIRTRDGGPRGVRALAIWLASQNRAQVSINLVEPTTTGFLPVFRAVEAAAAAAGVEIESSELIGLSPWSSLLEVAVDALKLKNFAPTQVLEGHFLGSQLRPEI